MQAIYEPKGKAKEYSPLACNLFAGCRHRCKYCYCPGILRKALDEWGENPQPRPGILDALEKDARRLGGMFPDKREVLFCFMSDPYQSKEAAEVTRQALTICAKHHLKAQVLTKGGSLACQDFDIMQRHGYKFGTTLLFSEEASREEWEPGAASIEERIATVRAANGQGIYTWISVEPVIDPEQAVEVIIGLLPWVDFWKVGKINHNAAIEAAVDWPAFLRRVRRAIPAERLYIKHDLMVAGTREST